MSKTFIKIPSRQLLRKVTPPHLAISPEAAWIDAAGEGTVFSRSSRLARLEAQLLARSLSKTSTRKQPHVPGTR